MTSKGILLLALAILVGGVGDLRARDLDGAALVEALRRGDHVVYFRHAETDWGQSDRIAAAGDWKSCDPARMRQLSEDGRATARHIGTAIRRLGIAVDRVLSSAYCRSRQTAEAMGLGPVEVTADIMNLRAASFVGGDEAVIRRARTALATPPTAGHTTIVVGHGNVMRAAIGTYTGEAGSAVLRPEAASPEGFVLVAVLSAEDWPRLADQFAVPAR